MSKGRLPLFFLLSGIVLLFSLLLGLCIGTASSSPFQVLTCLQNGNPQDALYRILIHVRIPRVLGAALAGCSFAASGVIIQGVLSNPLASPNVIGVNSGAGLFVLLASALFPYTALLPLAAFLGAMLATFVILLFTAAQHQSKLSLVLAGFALSSVFGAGMNTVLIFYPDAYVGASQFLVGGLSGMTMTRLLWPACYILPGLLLALASTRGLNLLSLGDDTAASLGMRVPLMRLLYLLIAAALAGAAVSFAGLIGFVGLLVPHAVRFFVGHDMRLLLPVCSIWGAIFVLLCDLLARSLFAPYELPVGILMAFIGGPFFLLLIVQNRRMTHDTT